MREYTKIIVEKRLGDFLVGRNHEPMMACDGLVVDGEGRLAKKKNETCLP